MNPNEHPEGHLLQAYHDGELEAGEVAAVEAHCDVCADCRRTVSELADLSAVLAAAPAPELPRTVWHRVKPSRATEPRFAPVFGLAAGALGVLIGILVGPIESSAPAETESTSWSESVVVWDGATTASLLSVFTDGRN